MADSSSPAKEQRLDVRKELTDFRESRQQATHRRWFQEWCSANGIPEEPTPNISSEQLLLRYLHSTASERSWGWGSCYAASTAAAQHLVRSGWNDPLGHRVNAWLKAKKRERGARETPPVDILTQAEVRATLTRWLEPERDAVAWRAAMALVDCMQDVLLAETSAGTALWPAVRKVAMLPSDALRVLPDSIRVTIDGRTSEILQARTPIHFTMVRAALGAEEALPFQAVGDSRRLAARLRQAVRTLTHATALPTARDAARWWTAAASDDRVKVLHLLDGSLLKRTQDCAMLLLGLAGLLRSAELLRLNLGHMRERDNGSGFDYSLEEHKSALLSARHGGVPTPLIGSVEHEAEVACSGICAACAVDKQMRLRRWTGATIEDPLFVNLHDKTFPRLTNTAYVSKVVRQAAGATVRDDDSPRRLSSRSLRASGATWLRAAGTSYAELQQMGPWSSADYARLYVRAHDASASSGLVLPLDDPSDH